jgi:hypothetical protein
MNFLEHFHAPSAYLHVNKSRNDERTVGIGLLVPDKSDFELGSQTRLTECLYIQGFGYITQMK